MNEKADTAPQLVQAQSGVGETQLAFRGNFTHTLDVKGRINLPADFRRVLSAAGEQAVVLTNYISDGARCLEGFGLKSWTNFENKLREKSRFSSKLQKLENFYLSRAAECPIDSNGRILLPQHLREYAGIEKDVTFTSSIHGFRVWDKRVWDVIFAAAEQQLMSNPDTFSDVDI
ncbi:MAG: division/cell wall cluster transcriptional repressor MraZ [Deltaproteobacteria bacterium]|nr:division/cell wall cluster transcriptional repressor MraZ [Deltaproteobacteria bacterium]